MNIATFRAKCQNSTCKHDFDAPLLSDFSYGEYIYSSIDGKEIKHYASIGCKTWDFIDHSLSTYFDHTDNQDIGLMIQKMIGFVADRQNPEVYFTQNIYCPKCQSRVHSIDENDKTGLNQYEHLTFHSFTNLSELKKKKLIAKYIEKI